MEYLIEMFSDGSLVEYNRVSEVADSLFCDVAVALPLATSEDVGCFYLPSNGDRGLTDAVRLLGGCERRRGKRYWATIVSWGGDFWLTDKNIEAIRSIFEEPDTQIVSLVESGGAPTGVYAFRADTMRRLSLLCAEDRGICEESWTQERFRVKQVGVEE